MKISHQYWIVLATLELTNCLTFNTMIFTFDSNKGFPEYILINKEEFKDFYSLCTKLQEELKITFYNIIEDFGSRSYDFIYDDAKLSVSYDTMWGISLHPTNAVETKPSDSIALSKLVKNIEAWD